MKELPVSLKGLRLFELPVFRDERGFFVERWREDKWAAIGFREEFKQDNHSRSLPRVLRGMHFQADPPQGKLVGCVRGRIFDVAVDLRKDSSTFGKWFGAELSEDNGRVLWVPFGFAHGFCVLGDQVADVVYKITGVYNPKTEGSLLWNDPTVGIDWPVKAPLLSPKDAIAPRLETLKGL